MLNVGASTYSVDVSLDPLDGSYNYCYITYEGVAETLFKISDDWTPEAWLATSAEPTDDTYTTWNVYLRDDVTYHNGDQMTAETVIECLQRAMDESEQAAGILYITSMEAADEYTITMTFDSAVVDLESELCNSVFAIYEVPEDGVDFDEGASFTGPFMPYSYEEGVSRTFVAYEDYYDGAALIDEVNYIVYTDTASQLVALDAGEIDFCMGVPFENLADYEASEDFEVSYSDPSSIEVIYFNENREATSDYYVKQAIAMALDRESICETVYYGYAEASYTLFPDSLYYGGDDGLDLTVTGYDLEGAAALLAEGGWEDTDGDGILDKDGVSLDLEVICYYDTYILGAAETLSTALSEIGINLTITAAYDYYNYEYSGEYDMIWYYEGYTRSGTPLYFLSTFLSTDGSGNNSGFSNETIDSVCEQLLTATDEDEITDLVKQAEQALADDGHMITWGYRDIAFVYSSDVTFTAHAYRYYMIDNTTDIAVSE